jgi:hypothetical protein
LYVLQEMGGCASAEMVRRYEKQLKRSERRAVYAMQVVRAALAWHRGAEQPTGAGNSWPGPHRAGAIEGQSGTDSAGAAGHPVAHSLCIGGGEGTAVAIELL